MQYTRLMSETALVQALKDLDRRVSKVETTGTGTISFVDSESGVETVVGVLPDGSTGVDQFVGDVTPPGKPSTPTAEGVFGGVSIVWDGLEDGGLPQPRDYARTVIEYSPDGVTWTVGVTVYDETSQIVPNLTAGTTYSFRLISYDQNGNASTPSTIVTAVPLAAADSGEVDQAIEDLLEADGILNGIVAKKTTNYYQPEMPTVPKVGPAFVEGDIWFDTNDGNKSYIYNGTTFVSNRDTGIAIAIGDADTALKAANGKNAITYSLSAAPAGLITGAKAGDTWFQKDSNGVIIGQWEYSGSAYIAKTVGEQVIGNLSAGKITSGFISVDRLQGEDIRTKLLTASKINAVDLLVQNSITAASGVIGSIDAAKITVGEMDGVRIKANSIFANRVLIGANGNSFPDPNFADIAGWPVSAGVTYSATGGMSGEGSATISQSSTQIGVFYAFSSALAARRFPLVAGAPYRVSAWVKPATDAPVGSIAVYLRAFNKANAFVAGTPAFVSNDKVLAAGVWKQVSGIITVPVGYPQGVLGVYKQASYTTGSVTFSDISVQEATSGELIVDGALTGKTITGALIQSKAAANEGIKLTDTQFVAYTNGIESLRFDGTNSIITGAVIRTAPTGARIQMDDKGMKAFDILNEEYFNLDPSYGIRMGRGAVTVEGTTYHTDPAQETPIRMIYGNGSSPSPLGGSDTLPTLRFQRMMKIPNGDGTFTIADDPQDKTPPGIVSFDGFSLDIKSATFESGRGGAFPDDESSLFLHHSLGAQIRSTKSILLDATGDIGADIAMWGTKVTINAPTYGTLFSARAGSADFATMIGPVGGGGAGIWFTPDGTRPASTPAILTTPANNLYIRGRAAATPSAVRVTTGLTVDTYLDVVAPPTSTFTANVGISSSPPDRIYKVSSSGKDKLAQQVIMGDKAKRILSVPPKTWFDRNNSERYADFVAGKEGVSLEDVAPMRRVPGVVAEEVLAAGLEEFVTFDAKGNVEAVAYDRMWVLLIPLVKELYSEIAALKAKSTTTTPSNSTGSGKG